MTAWRQAPGTVTLLSPSGKVCTAIVRYATPSSRARSAASQLSSSKPKTTSGRAGVRRALAGDRVAIQLLRHGGGKSKVRFNSGMNAIQRRALLDTVTGLVQKVDPRTL